MNRQKDLPGQLDFNVRAKNCTGSSSSNYSTCSDDLVGNIHLNKEYYRTSTQSTILAGSPNLYKDMPEITSRESEIYHLTNDTNNESNYTINLLDQNIDIFTEEDEVFVDCKDNSKSDSNDDSTKYLSLGLMSQLKKIKSNNCSDLNKLNKNIPIMVDASNDSLPEASKDQNEQLMTIMEETEVIRVINSSNKPSESNKTGELIVEIVDKLKAHDKVTDANKTSLRRVLFANEDNTKKDDNQEFKANKFKLKKQKNCTLLGSKNKRDLWKSRDINENCNNHNTTESFILWEKFCETSEKLSSRRSFSFSELNSINESYGGDDECSTSYKSLDDTYLSRFSIDTLNDEDTLRKNAFKRSKSCDSLLRHLPHILYDRFLKCLSKEIENIRKQNVVCTCRSHYRKYKNKENKDNNTKRTAVNPQVKVSNGKSDKKETKDLLTVSPLKTISNQTRLSPESLLKNSSQNLERLSPKSPNKSSITPKRSGLYSWRKEIVSPVGEYIRGKRQSPFQNSPSKKK